MTNNRYGYPCEYCSGTVQPRLVAREVFKHRLGFVLLENVVIGICDECGNRYYSTDILHTVQEITTGKRKAEWHEAIPVVHLPPAELVPVA
ncbi:MAG: YgiT-type zinc finger protein [Caldilineaceae bacterium]